jgi:hypothetical protein
MKKIFTILILIVLMFSNSALTFAIGGPKKADNRENTIASLLEGLTSENTGLKSGSAYMLGELKVTAAVIPLMKVLKNNGNVEVRISAALALYKIGTPLSISAVKKAIRFDESGRLKKLAQNFYAEFVRNQRDGENIAENYLAQSE